MVWQCARDRACLIWLASQQGMGCSQGYYQGHSQKLASILQVGTVFSLPEKEEMPTSLGKGKQITFEEPAYELTVGNCGEYSR